MKENQKYANTRKLLMRILQGCLCMYLFIYANIFPLLEEYVVQVFNIEFVRSVIHSPDIIFMCLLSFFGGLN